MRFIPTQDPLSSISTMMSIKREVKTEAYNWSSANNHTLDTSELDTIHMEKILSQIDINNYIDFAPTTTSTLNDSVTMEEFVDES